MKCLTAAISWHCCVFIFGDCPTQAVLVSVYMWAVHHMNMTWYFAPLINAFRDTYTQFLFRCEDSDLMHCYVKHPQSDPKQNVEGRNVHRTNIYRNLKYIDMLIILLICWIRYIFSWLCFCCTQFPERYIFLLLQFYFQLLDSIMKLLLIIIRSCKQMCMV